MKNRYLGFLPTLEAEENAAIRSSSLIVLYEAGNTGIESVNGEDAISWFQENSGNIMLALLDSIISKMSMRRCLK